jgi:hypothetical protein
MDSNGAGGLRHSVGRRIASADGPRRLQTSNRHIETHQDMQLVRKLMLCIFVLLLGFGERPTLTKWSRGYGTQLAGMISFLGSVGLHPASLSPPSIDSRLNRFITVHTQ